MVVVAVTEHHRIHPGQVQPQGGGIVRKCAGGAGIHQQGMAGSLDIQAQAVFMGAARYAGGVFDQGNDTHSGTLLYGLSGFSIAQGAYKGKRAAQPKLCRPKGFAYTPISR